MTLRTSARNASSKHHLIVGGQDPNDAIQACYLFELELWIAALYRFSILVYGNNVLQHVNAAGHFDEPFNGKW